MRQHVGDEGVGRWRQRLVRTDEEAVRAGSRPVVGQQFDRQVGISEREVPIVGDQLDPEPQGLRAGQCGQLGAR
nr:hypothetical protein [Modestobacter excelsi]